MTTTPSHDGRGSNNPNSDVDDLARGLDGSLRQQAEAIADFFDVRFEQAINGFVVRLSALETGTPGRAEAARAVRAAQEVRTDESRVAAEAAVEQAEQGSGNASPARTPRQTITPAEVPDGLTLAGAHARIDQLESCQAEVQVVSASAYACARSKITAPWGRAGKWAAVAFVVTFVLYFLVVIYDNRTWDWSWAIGLPAVVAGLVAALIPMLSHEDGPGANSFAAAEAITERWAAAQNNSGQTPQRTPNTASVEARADAGASMR